MNFKIALSVCLASMALLSCSDDNAPSESAGQSFQVIDAHLPYALTRLDYTEDDESLDLDINWSDSDEIAVYSANKFNAYKNRFVITDGSGSKHGTFGWSSVHTKEKDPVYVNTYNMFAIYPFSKAPNNKNGLNKINISVSSTDAPIQLLNHDYSHLKNHDIMLSKITMDEEETPALAFSPMMSILTVKYHGLQPDAHPTTFNLNIKDQIAFYKSRQLVLYALDESGAADYTESNAAYWSTTALSEVAKVYLQFGENCQVDADGCLTMHLPIIPTDKVKGQAVKFVLSFTNPDNTDMTKTIVVKDFPANFEPGKHYVKNITLTNT